MKLRMWIGNHDGRQLGLVIASTKKRALEVINQAGRTGRKAFDDFWDEATEVDPGFDVETLYLSPMDTRPRVWKKFEVKKP